MATIKLTEIVEPELIITLPDGTERSYSFWDLGRKIEQGMRCAIKDDDATLGRTFDVVRKAFGFPTAAEREAVLENKPFTLTPAQCMAMQRQVNEFLEGYDKGKK